MRSIRLPAFVLIAISLLHVALTDLASARRGRFNLDDCDSSIAVVIAVSGDSIRLTWRDLPGVSEWVVLRGWISDLSDLEIVTVVTDTVFVESPAQLSTAHRAFYRISAVWPEGSPQNYEVIEDFDVPVPLMSYPGSEDAEPDGWRWSNDGVFNNFGWSLELFRNTWKSLLIDPIRLDSHSVWRIGAKSLSRGECQAIGVADSSNEMWYVLWGREVRQSKAWIAVYQGWYASQQWAQVDLPIGADWKGRFGYYPAISRITFANDNDTVSTRGRWRVDEIRDVSRAINLPPVARFQWRITGYPTPDSMEVSFCSMGCDPDGPLYHQFWTFGDGTSGWGANPLHRYASGGEYPVTLTVQDTAGRADWIVYRIADTTSNASRRLTFLFTGDVMLGRRYDEPGGIIPTQGVNAIFAPTQALTSAFDLTMCNLESPLTNAVQHHPTKSYYFKGRPEYVQGLQYAGFDYCALGNNHNFDYLTEGMHETKRVLDSVAILSSGAGDNEEMARVPSFFTKNGLTIAILSFCNRDGSFDNEQPFLAAGSGRPGFAMWDRTNIERTIPRVRTMADFVIVQVHSGIEYSVNPPLSAEALDQRYRDDRDEVILELLPDTSDLQLRRLAIDLGADLVVNHHPHVIQGCEMYQGKLIAHSMGNFAFDQQLTETFLSMVISGEISAENGVSGFVVHPVYIDRYIPRFPTGELRDAILWYIAEIARPLGTWMLFRPGDSVATILPDTLFPRSFADSTFTVVLETRGGSAVSAPVLIPGAGYLTQVTVQGPQGTQFRVGRELLMHGNIENEGATPWDLNSNYERYDTVTFFRGRRSIGLNRSGGGTNSVSTNYVYRMPFDRSAEHSMAGWMRGTNCLDTRLDFQFWNRRTGGDLVSVQTIGDTTSGTFGWRRVWEDIVLQPGGFFFNIRVNLRAPLLGEGWAWFDDLIVVRWNEWQTTTAILPFPNNLSYLQVRAPAGTTQVIVTSRREWVDSPALAAGQAGVTIEH